MSTKEKIKAVAYMRTNKSEVGDQLGDLHMQYQSILKFAGVQKFTVVKSFDDFGVKEKSRLYDVLDYCRANRRVATVVTKTQTRISRNVQEFKDWESIFAAIGVRLEFVEQSVISAPDEFLKSLSATIAKLDSSNRSESIKRGILNRVQGGYSVQKPPKGYMNTAERGLFAKDPDMTDYLHSTITRFLGGVLSYEDFRRAVSLLFSKDKLLSRSKFKAVVTNPYYAGYVCYDGKKYKGLHEPLLTEAEYNKLTILLDK
jgi:site-specific DNA recombinase